MTSRGQKDGTFSFLPMDLSGKLMIKARLGDDFRRVPIHNEDITYDELLLMLQRVFKGKLNNSDDVTIKYCDEEGDYITISDSSDLNLAKQISRQLKIIIFVHGKEPLPSLDASEVGEVRKELVAIRDKVNTLLDALSGTSKGGDGRVGTEPSSHTVPRVESSKQVSHTETAVSRAEQETKVKTAPTGSLGIFDPLKPSSSQPSTPASTASTTQQGSTTHLFSQGSSGDFISQQQPPSQTQSGYPSSGYPSTAIPQTVPGQATQQRTQQQTGQVDHSSGSFYSQQQTPQQGYSTGQQQTFQSPQTGGYPQTAPAPTPPPSSQVHTPSQYPPGASYPASGAPQGNYYGFQQGQAPPSQTGFSGFPKQGQQQQQYNQQTYRQGYQ